MSSELPIDVRGLSKTFRSPLLRRPKNALVAVDLFVRPGEIFGFLGPNGAGKTTTIKILLGLIRPTEGTGTVLERAFGSRDARRELGFVPDSPNFYRCLNARELLDFTGRLHGLRGADLARRIEETLDRVGLAPDARRRALRTYSRGMLQRTGIAAAILHRPRLVVLDEPMNGLDPLGRREFRDLLLSLKAEGTTVFLSSHVLGDIEATADRVGILDGGRLVQCGPLGEILRRGERRVELAFEVPGDEALQAVSSGLSGVQRGARGWIAVAPDPETADAALRRLLERGGRLLAYQRRRVSLEEFFLSQVGRASGIDREDAPGPEASRPDDVSAGRTARTSHPTPTGEMRAPEGVRR